MSVLIPFTTVRKYKDLTGVCICPGTAEPKPFHIAFLLDTSGSMEGERIDTVKRTLRLFAEELVEGDRVTLISYNSSAQLLCAKEGREKMLEAVDQLKAWGGTNMETGISKLLDVDLVSVDAVFLLTDGEVNQGIISVKGLETLVREVAFRHHAIPVYTLGYGDAHNAKLLQAIALTTRSSYTYAEANEMIPSVVGNILVAMREEVAKGVAIEWDSDVDCDVECRELGYTGGTSYMIGSLLANKTQWVLFKGPLPRLWIRVGSGDRVPLDVPLEGEDDAVLEQDFRIRCAKLLERPILSDLQQLEQDIRASSIARNPLAIRILAELAVQQDHMTSAAYQDIQQIQQLRTMSHMTAFANQRGVDCFHSPTQRHVSQQMVQTFHQDPC